MTILFMLKRQTAKSMMMNFLKNMTTIVHT